MTPASSTSVTTQDDLLLFHKSLLPWTVSFLIIGGITIYGTEMLDYGWGVILIIAALLTWKNKNPSMYIVYVGIMGWSGAMNTLSLLLGDPEDKWWVIIGLVQLAWTVLIVRQYRKFQHLRTGNEAVIFSYFGRASAIISGIILFLVPCACACWGISLFTLKDEARLPRRGYSASFSTPYFSRWLTWQSYPLGLAWQP
ncbi:MAG TPA: hypothetical protein VF831_06700 [Anaerolineales bacterium]